MTPQFNNECFSLGFLEAMFVCNKYLSGAQLSRYLDLCEKYKQKPNEDIVKFKENFNS